MRYATTSAVLLATILTLLAGCGSPVVDFPYASESYAYPEPAVGLQRVHLGAVDDLRTADQREGRGFLAGVTYPSDDEWSRPVVDLYREALSRDLTQTNLLELTPMPSQADFVLEAEIHSFHCRLERGASSFVLPVLAGSLVGFALGDDADSRLKRAALLSVVGIGAIPMPADQRAEAIIRLKLRDRNGELVWDRTCTGAVEGGAALSATARVDEEFAERDLPLAVKRANACLLGQLREHLAGR